MPLLADKILGLLAMPLGIAVSAGLLALAALVLGRRRGAAELLVFAIVWLWGWSTPLAGNALINSLMDRYPPRRAETLPTADAIVLLGGGIQPISDDRLYPELTGSADRIWHAARIHQAGKAPLIVVSGGNVWGTPGMEPEAGAMRTLLTTFGVPEHAIVTETGSRNTRESAVLTAELAAGRGIGRVLLVTSAWHMPRAAAVFERTGLDVVPAATDHGRQSARPWILMILPDAGALGLSTRAFKEYIGLLVYRIRGWA